MADRQPAGIAVPDPAVALDPMPFRARLADVARFCRRPTPYPMCHSWSWVLVFAVLVVFAFDYAVDTLVWIFTVFIEEGLGQLAEPIEFEETFTQELIGSLLFAPLYEEAVYRGWLSGRVAALRFALFGFLAEFLFICSNFVGGELSLLLGLLGLVVLFIGLFIWSARRQFETEVPEWFTRNFHWFVWGSSLAFGLIHLSNYEAFYSPLGVLLVLPQAIGGIFLAYTRTRLGLRASMLHHALYNGVSMLLYYATIPGF